MKCNKNNIKSCFENIFNMIWTALFLFYTIQCGLNISSLMSWAIFFSLLDRGHSLPSLFPTLQHSYFIYIFVCVCPTLRLILILSHLQRTYPLVFAFILSFWLSYHPFLSWNGFPMLPRRSVFILIHHSSSLILIWSSLIFSVFWWNIALCSSAAHLIYL